MEMTGVNDYCSVVETDGKTARDGESDVWKNTDFMLRPVSESCLCV